MGVQRKSARRLVLALLTGAACSVWSAEALGDEAEDASRKASEPAEPTPTSVTGSVLLGLLPYTIPRGALGVGGAVAIDEFSEEAGVAFGPSISFGVTDWMTLGAAVPFSSANVDEERVTGLGNIGVCAQFVVYQDDGSPLQISATPGVSLPSATEAAPDVVTPDVKASGAVNAGVVAVNLTARGRVDVPANGGEAIPGATGALSIILVDETIAPFIEAGLDVAPDVLLPMGAVGLNWAPGAGTLFTAGVPIIYDQGELQPGVAFTAYFETGLFGSDENVAASV